MATLKKYRTDLGWNTKKLAEEAGIARQSANSAERGGIIQAETAKAIADALSNAYGREIKPSDIEGLNIR